MLIRMLIVEYNVLDTAVDLALCLMFGAHAFWDTLTAESHLRAQRLVQTTI